MSNAIYHWNDSGNPYVPPAVGVIAAWLVTWLLVRVLWLREVWKLRRESRLQ